MQQFRTKRAACRQAGWLLNEKPGFARKILHDIRDSDGHLMSLSPSKAVTEQCEKWTSQTPEPPEASQDWMGVLALEEVPLSLQALPTSLECTRGVERLPWPSCSPASLAQVTAGPSGVVL